MNPVKLTSDQIKRLVYGIESLQEAQRALVSETLSGLMQEHQQIWPQDLQRALRRLRDGYKISELDEKSIASAVFP